MILEIDLHDLVREPEHDGMLGAHPLLNIDRSWRILELVGLVQKISLDQLLLLLWVIILL